MTRHFGETDPTAFSDKKVLDFAAGHVIGLRLFRAINYPRLWGPHRYAMRSMYCSYIWQMGENKAICLHHEQVGSKDGLPLRTRYCVEVHPHHAYVYDQEAFAGPECRTIHDRHRIDPQHSCGFYAYTETKDNPYIGAIDMSIEGVIQGWGRTVIGTKGFRCEFARILGIVLPPYHGQSYRLETTPAQIAESIARSYKGVRIFSSRELLLRAFPLSTGMVPAAHEGDEG